MRKVYHAQFQNANNRKLVKSFEDMGDNVYNEKAHPATGFAILKLNLMVRHIFSKWLLCFAKKADIIIIVILLEGWKPHGYGIFSSPLWGVVPNARYTNTFPKKCSYTFSYSLPDTDTAYNASIAAYRNVFAIIVDINDYEDSLHPQTKRAAYKEIQAWAKQHYGIRSYLNIGKMDSFLYVSDSADERQADRDGIESDGEVLAFVFNHDDPKLSEIGYVGIEKTSAAGLRRIW